MEQNAAVSGLATQLRSIVVDVGGLPEDFDPAANLYSELGIASVKALQLLMEIEEKVGLTLPDDRFVEATSLHQLVALVEQLMPGGVPA